MKAVRERRVWDVANTAAGFVVGYYLNSGRWFDILLTPSYESALAKMGKLNRLEGWAA